MEDPATAKGLVKRDIIRVVTPGTVIDAACLEEKASNFLCGIYIDSQNAGAAFCDISTGKTHLAAFSGAMVLSTRAATAALRLAMAVTDSSGRSSQLRSSRPPMGVLVLSSTHRLSLIHILRLGRTHQ